MARIIGGLTTSHIPAIGGAVPREDSLRDDPYWKPFFGGYDKAREWLSAHNPDVAVVIYNDHGLNFFLDKLPAFAIGAAPEYRNADEGWGIPTIPPFKGRSRVVLAYHQLCRGRGLRLDDLSGDVGGSWFHRAYVAVLEGQCVRRCEDHPSLYHCCPN